MTIKEIEKSKSNRLSKISSAGILIIFTLLIIWFSILNSRFLTINNFSLIFMQAAPIGIVTIGMTLVMVTGGIDISVGRNMFFVSAVITALTMRGIFPPSLHNTLLGNITYLSFALILGGLVGLINGILVSKFNLQPFIVTLSTGSILRGLALTLTASSTPDTLYITNLTNGSFFNIPNVVIMFVFMLILIDYLMKKTVLGRRLMAIGSSKQRANKAGINVDRNIIIAYVLCGVLAGLGGILSAGQIGGVALNFGEGQEFIAISAAVIGGTSLFGGKARVIPGVIIGVLLITIIMNGLAMINASPYIYTIVRGFIIFIAVSLDVINIKGFVK